MKASTELQADCLDENTAVAFVSGTLDQAALAAINDHLDACADCRRLIRELAHGLDSRRAEPPAEVEGVTEDALPCSSARRDGIAAHRRIDADAFDDLSAALSDAAPDTSPDPLIPGSAVGRYIVIDLVGAGGMGVVYAAYDPELDRKVALKLLRPDTAAERSPQRLLLEAKALAQLSHPNVIPIHDVGTLGEHVFIAMEFVEGQTLRAWLHEEQRGWREVVSKYVQAGSGLHAAHEAGLIHRDFKPDNVLLGEDGRVRVTDFGLARWAGTDDAAVSDASLAAAGSGLTETGMLLGTPAYMAPEQLRGEAADACADQFGFCVALYEGLYGERPFTGHSVRSLLEAINKEEVRPAPARAKVPVWLRRLVLRGCRADPRDRYSSMGELLAAIQRDPALPRRRALGAVALTVALATTWVVASRSSVSSPCDGYERQLIQVWDPAVQSRVQGAFLATERPYAAAVYERVAATLDNYAHSWVSAQADACEATHVHRVLSAEILDLRTACLVRRLGELRGFTELLGEGPDANVLDQAVQAASALTPVDGCSDTDALPETGPRITDEQTRTRAAALRAKLDRARALDSTGKYDDGLALIRTVGDEAKQLGFPLLRAEFLYLLGSLQSHAGNHAAAEEALRSAVVSAAEANRDLLAAQAWSLLLWVVGVEQRRQREALLLRPAAEAAVARAGHQPLVEALFLNNLGAIYGEHSDYRQAIRYQERALAISERALGSEHVLVAKSLNNLGFSYGQLGHHDVAIKHIERALAIRQRAMGPEHPGVAGALRNIGHQLQRQSRYAEAHSYYQRALEIYQSALGDDHPMTISALSAVGRALHGQRKYELATRFHERALAALERAPDPNPINISYSLNSLGEIALDHGEHDEAQRYLERALELRERALGPDHHYVAFPLENLGLVFYAKGEHEKAMQAHRRSLQIVTTAIGPDSADAAYATNYLGRLYRVQRKYAQARRHHQRALELFEGSFGPEHESVAAALTGLGWVEIGLGNPTGALDVLERALAIYQRANAGPAQLADVRSALARALWNSRQHRERSLQLARAALSDYRRAGQAPKSDRASLEEWLEKRRANK
ncbi:MAG: serine/threonine-protein kinase [Proteobacteria bacterium]|nr:serine/threonine-protein kinase [Pseudomonadota bacterium]